MEESPRDLVAVIVALTYEVRFRTALVYVIAELKKIITTSKNMFLHFYSHSHPHKDLSLSWSVDVVAFLLVASALIT